LKVAAIVLIRNEIDIAATFLRHVDALFDYVLLMDHGSIDGTERLIEQACAQRPGWTMWHVEPVGYHQTAFNTFALRYMMQTTDADFFIFLDADEFIDVPGRAIMHAAFRSLTDPDRIGNLAWRNIVPDQFGTRTIHPGEPVWSAPSTLPMGKVVIPRQFIDRHDNQVNLAIGNHFLYYAPDNFVPHDTVGEILHFPIRSHAQIKNKITAGVFATMARADREPEQAWHWYDILWRIADGNLRDEDLIGMAAYYSVAGAQTSKPLSWQDLEATGFTRTELNVAFGQTSPHVTGELSIDPVRLMATILRRFTVENSGTNELALEGGRLRFAAPATGESRQ
jgi:glycosyltransferase involved in cell wall biosynthesis